MKIGFSLPNIGPIGTADSITKVAQRARLSDTAACGRSNAYCIHLSCKDLIRARLTGTCLKFINRLLIRSTLSLTSPRRTKKINLGTSVLDMPYHNPVVLARRLTTLDVLSNGRLLVGLGLGWNKDEMDATGADMTKRGALADEFLPLLKAIWTENPVEFHGKFFNVPRSYIDLKPVQKPHPPIYLGAFVPAALKRLAKLADGWNPVFFPVPVMAETFGTIKQMAKEAGRDPSAMAMIVHAVLEITEKPLSKDRPIFSGSLEQISEDVRGCAKIGADESSLIRRLPPGGNRSSAGCLCWTNFGE